MKFETKYDKVCVLAKTAVEYIAITYGLYYKKLVIFYSYWFLLKVLEAFAESSATKNFKILSEKFPNPEEFHPITQKGVYPYEHIRSIETILEK